MYRLHPEILFKKDEAMPLTLKQGNLTEVSSPSFCAGRKCGEVEQALLWSLLQEEPECPSRVLLDKVAERQIAMAVSLRHVNRWRATWGMNRRKGRPGHAQGRLAVACGAEVVRVVPHVAFVGVHLFAHWLDQQHTFEPVVAQLPAGRSDLEAQASRRGLCPAASPRADATSPLSSAVFR